MLKLKLWFILLADINKSVNMTNKVCMDYLQNKQVTINDIRRVEIPLDLFVQYGYFCYFNFSKQYVYYIKKESVKIQLNND